MKYEVEIRIENYSVIEVIAENETAAREVVESLFPSIDLGACPNILDDSRFDGMADITVVEIHEIDESDSQQADLSPGPSTDSPNSTPKNVVDEPLRGDQESA
jgi:hypothetical protein